MWTRRNDASRVRQAILLFAATCLIAVNSRIASAQTNSALSGSPRIQVKCDVDRSLSKVDFVPEVVQRTVELALARNRIPIATEGSDGKLFVDILALELPDRSSYSIYVSVYYMEWVDTVRVGARRFAEVWRRGGLLALHVNFMYKVRESVMGMVEDFCLDYLKANQK